MTNKPPVGLVAFSARSKLHELVAVEVEVVAAIVGCVYTVSLNLGLLGTVDPLSLEIVALVMLRLDAFKPPFYIYTLASAYPSLVVVVDFTPVK